VQHAIGLAEADRAQHHCFGFERSGHYLDSEADGGRERARPLGHRNSG
jgi:hypothetical protein